MVNAGDFDERPDPSARPLLGVRCLLIEDFGELAVRQAAVLERAGASVTIALTLAAALSAIAEALFDLAVVDLRLPDGDGAELVRELVRRKLRTGLLVLSGYLDPRESKDLYESGAICVHKDESPLPLVALGLWAMSRASRLRGNADSITPASGWLPKCSAAATFARRYGLTKREGEVFEQVAMGISTKEIAAQLGSVPETVRRQIQCACRKCGVSGQTELVARFLSEIMSGGIETDASYVRVRPGP